jgi:hypothetical protein
MKRIVFIPQLFTKEQRILVYDNGERIDTVNCTLEEAPAQIYLVAKANEVTDIKLAGPSSYVSNIKRQLEQKSMQEYDKNIFTIELI